MIENLIGVHIPLPKKWVREIQQLSKRLNLPYESYYGLPPHITLHLARIEKNGFPRLVSSIAKLPVKPFTVRLTSLMCDTQSRRVPIFIAKKIYKSRALLHLHERIVLETNAVRGGLIRTKDLKRIQEGLYTKEEIAYIHKYGYLLVMKNYMPHISLGAIHGSVSKTQQREIQKTIRQHADVLRGYTFSCEKIIVGLYPFDTKKQDFVKSRKIERTINL